MSEITFVFVELRRKNLYSLKNYLRDKLEKYFPMTEFNTGGLIFNGAVRMALRLKWRRTVKMAVFGIRIVTPSCNSENFLIVLCLDVG